MGSVSGSCLPSSSGSDRPRTCLAAKPRVRRRRDRRTALSHPYRGHVRTHLAHMVRMLVACAALSSFCVCISAARPITKHSHLKLWSDHFARCRCLISDRPCHALLGSLVTPTGSQARGCVRMATAGVRGDLPPAGLLPTASGAAAAADDGACSPRKPTGSASSGMRYTILDTPPWIQAVGLGFQVYLTMLGSSVLIPFITVVRASVCCSACRLACTHAACVPRLCSQADNAPCFSPPPEPIHTSHPQPTMGGTPLGAWRGVARQVYMHTVQHSTAQQRAAHCVRHRRDASRSP